ncbi:ABC transporter substrate-binding protein [Clostridium hydrogeniformans]|uniref:ABC transporter substrate-binding protein n=1 Tax=Clostridium hydrogeniformans TaxID=349933 RepID=UPI0004862787|nr:ABC transporter substrate-binding protein [Clostridium hydrogeniformans]
MNKKKIMATMAGIMTLSVALTACGSSEKKPNKGNEVQEDQTKNQITVIEATNKDKVPAKAKERKDTLIIGLGQPDGVFNPLYSDSAYDTEVNRVLFSKMLAHTEDGQLKEHLTDMPKVSDDKKTYTFKIKDGAKWSDGQPITTDDIELSFKIMCDKTYTGPQDMPSLKLKGWKDYNEGKSDKIEGIKKIDKQTIEFTVDEGTALTKELINIEPLPNHYYGKTYKQGSANLVEELHRKPEVTSGAYKFASFKEGQEVVLKADENYFKGKAKIENIIFKVVTDKTVLAQVESGEVDFANLTIDEDNVEQLKGMEFVNINYYPNNGYGYVGLNLLGDSKLKDVKVRQALAHGLNRQELVEKVFGKYADNMNVPQSKLSWAYPKDAKMEEYKYDKEKAQKLLEEAGWKKNSSGKLEKDGKVFTLKFLQTANSDVPTTLVPIAKKCYEDLGIEFIAEQLDFPTLRKKLDDAKAGKPNADYDMYFMAWVLTPEPDATTIFTSKGTQNRTGYANPKVDELMEKATKEFDVEKRKELYKDLYIELNKDLPYIYMYQRSNGFAVSSRVKNFKDSAYVQYGMNIGSFELE